MNLSAHFTLDEATFSPTAERLGIDNTPPPEVIYNMQQAALGMEKVRMELGGLPIHINSWYRCPALNTAIGSKPTSAHVTGWAIDFTCPKFGTPMEIMYKLRDSKIVYQQLILEFPKRGGWIHIAFNGDKRQALVIDSNGVRAFA